MKLNLILCIIWILMIISVFGQKPKKRKEPGMMARPGQVGAMGAPNPAAAQQSPPEIDWGKCPQLAPTKAEAMKKKELTDKCLAKHPIPTNLNEKTVKAHSKQITECALKEDKWFDKRGKYRFSRTTVRLTNKKLPKTIESQLIEHSRQCRTEAEQKFPKKQNTIDLVTLFQACMNFHTTKVCGIKAKKMPA